jgi:3-phosphoshikimate 1-carboxyvinyltransferase
MSTIVHPAKKLQGEFMVPGDKSISHRAIIFGAIAQGTTEIDGFLMGQDCLSTIECFAKMGINIEQLPKNKIKIYGKGLHGLKAPIGALYTGNSGTTTRLLIGLLAGQEFESTIDGDESIRRRPMKRVVLPLKKMGAHIMGKKDDNYCPLVIEGRPLQGIRYKLPVASAQLKSALLLASLYAEENVFIIEPQKSRDHSELMLNYFGANITLEDNIICSKPVSKLEAQHITVPGDISSAAYFLVAGLIVPNSAITIKNVGINPTRTGIIDVLTAMGGNIGISNIRIVNNEPVGDITVSSSSLSGTVIEGAIIPRLIDEIPVIAVAAAATTGTTIIKDAQELKVKESNRIKTVVTELSKAGVDITETKDGMIINGGKRMNGVTFESYGDHRIAMAMSIAALIADSPSTINGAEAVDISFPGFWEMLKGL